MLKLMGMKIVATLCLKKLSLFLKDLSFQMIYIHPEIYEKVYS